MKILLWNCNNGISQPKQIDCFNSFKCDLAIIPEIKEHNIETLNPNSSIWVTNNFENKSPKGLGILAFNNFTLQELSRDEDMEIFIPLKVKSKKIEFTILAVWNFYWACKQGRFKNVKGEDCLEWSAIRHYQNILKDPSIVVGDWNFGPTFSQVAFVKMVNIFEEIGLKSIYHEYNQLPITETKNFTYKSPMKTYHHLDHMFGTKYFLDNIKNFVVGDINETVLSDHSPLLLEI